jgi:hypothetical protein
MLRFDHSLKEFSFCVYLLNSGYMHTTFWSQNLKGRDHLENNSHRWEGNIRMDLKEIMWEVVKWSHLDQDRDQ